MTRITLTAEEAEALEGVLRYYLPILWVEIRRTENWKLRKALHKEEDLLRGLLQRLEKRDEPVPA